LLTSLSTRKHYKIVSQAIPYISMKRPPTVKEIIAMKIVGAQADVTYSL